MKKVLFACCLLLASTVQAQAPTPQPEVPSAVPSANTDQNAVTSLDLPKNQSADHMPTQFRVDPISLNARLSAGPSFGPSAFWITGDLEVQLDKFVALGPKIQFGTNSSTNFLLGSLGPRFTVPVSYFEFGVNAGFGFAHRDTAGFQFTNFLYEAGLNFDTYLYKNFSVGVGYNANIMSSPTNKFISVLLVSIAGHY